MSKEKQKHRIKDSLTSAPDSSPTRALGAAKSPLAERDQATDIRESELLDGTTTHMTADHEIREEQPRISFEHFTSFEDERPIKRSSRTDQQIAKAVRESKTIIIGKRCELHSTPDCSVCFTTELHLQHKEEIKAYYDKYRVVVTKIAPTAGPNTAPIDVPTVPLLKGVSQLRVEWGLEESSIEKRHRQATAETQAQDEARAKRRVEAGLKTIPNLRREHGYDARKLASLLDHSGFNITILKTDYSLLDTNKTYRRRLAKISNDTSKKSSKALARLMNSLPLKEVPLFSTEEITSYKAHASRNYTKRGLEERGTDFDNTLRLENAIIKRAWELRLLKPQQAESGTDDLQSQLDREHRDNTGHDHETAVNQRAAEVGGTIIGAGFYEPSGKALSAKSFERGPMYTKQAHDTDFAGEEGGATAEDDYGEEGGA